MAIQSSPARYVDDSSLNQLHVAPICLGAFTERPNYPCVGFKFMWFHWKRLVCLFLTRLVGKL